MESLGDKFVIFDQELGKHGHRCFGWQSITFKESLGEGWVEKGAFRALNSALSNLAVLLAFFLQKKRLKMVYET